MGGPRVYPPLQIVEWPLATNNLVVDKRVLGLYLIDPRGQLDTWPRTLAEFSATRGLSHELWRQRKGGINAARSPAATTVAENYPPPPTPHTPLVALRRRNSSGRRQITALGGGSRSSRHSVAVELRLYAAVWRLSPPLPDLDSAALSPRVSGGVDVAGNYSSSATSNTATNVAGGVVRRRRRLKAAGGYNRKSG